MRKGKLVIEAPAEAVLVTPVAKVCLPSPVYKVQDL